MKETPHPQDLRAEKTETWSADEKLSSFKSEYCCNRCATEVDKDDKYCRMCGKKFM